MQKRIYFNQFTGLLFGVLEDTAEDLLITRPSTVLSTVKSLHQLQLKDNSMEVVIIENPGARELLEMESKLVYHNKPQLHQFLEFRGTRTNESPQWAVQRALVKERRKELKMLFKEADPLKDLYNPNASHLSRTQKYVQVSQREIHQRKELKRIYHSPYLYFHHRYAAERVDTFTTV